MVCACCAARSPLFPRFVCVRISFLPKVLLGDMGAGKSSLVLRFVKGKFTDYQESTIGAAFLTKTLPELSVKFEIWDTAGQERYHSLAPMYYRGAAAAIVVYDMTSADSFKRAKDWVKVRNLGTSPLCPHRPVLCFDICERHKKKWMLARYCFGSHVVVRPPMLERSVCSTYPPRSGEGMAHA